jgi:hypothetical protein
MLRISLAVTAACSLLAAAFGLGVWWGVLQERPQARAAEAHARALRGEAGPAAAVRAALLEPDGIARVAALLPVLEELGPDNVEEVVAVYEDAFPGGGGIAMQLLFEAWSRFAPEEALARALGWPPEKKSFGANQLFFAWARLDPGAARRALQGVEDVDVLQGGVRSALIRGWDQSGKPGVWEYVASLPRGMERQRLTNMLVHVLERREGVAGVMRRVEALPDEGDEEFKQTAFRQAAPVVTRRDPRKAAAWVERHAQREYGSGLLRKVGTVWAEQDGPAAMAWLGNQPAGKERDAAVEVSYRKWQAKDRAAAMAWLRRAEYGPWLDPALGIFARELATQHPEGAVAWAERIQDPERREKALVAVARVWLNRDEEAARAWLETSPLSAEAKRSAVEYQRPRRPQAGGR